MTLSSHPLFVWSYITSAVWCRILQCLSLVIAINVKAEHSQNDKMSQILSSKSCEIWRHRKVNSWSKTNQKNISFHRLLKIVSSNKILLATYKTWSSVSKSELWDPRWPQLILLKHRHVVLCQSAFLYVGTYTVQYVILYQPLTALDNSSSERN